MEGLQSRLDALFAEELHDNLRVLSEGAAALEDPARDISGDDDLIRRLFRAAHSLKGAAHAAGVVAAVQPCHRLEELLAGVRAGDLLVDDALITAFLSDLDVLVTVEESLRAPTAVADSPRQDAPTDDATSRGSARPDRGVGRARVAVARLDQLVHRTGALVTATEQVGALAADIAAAEDAASASRRRAIGDGAVAGDQAVVTDALGRLSLRAKLVDRQLRRLVAETADTAQQLRLQPFGDVVTGLDRSVRELCRATNTDAQLVTTGEHVELDRDIGDAIRDPLLHLLRNAVAHGIEDAGARVAAGKPAQGTLRLTATTEGPLVAITVADDGAGIDVAGLRESAHREGLDPAGDGLELAFHPGVSTAGSVTDVAGRGVGLDAVRVGVEGLGGTVHVRSETGQGTEVTIHVPRTLAVVRAIVVGTGGDQVMALPCTGLGRLHRVAAESVAHVEGRLSVRTTAGRVPAVPLARAAGDHDAPRIAVEVAGEDGVLLVDHVQTELDVVLRPLPSRVRDAAGILGAALLPSGQIALVVNPVAALRAGLSATTPVTAPPPEIRRHTVLLAEDTLTTRALERSILQGAGYDVVTAVDGAEAWDVLQGRSIDLVVSDVDMPRMDGIQLCRAIRASGGLANLPVVLVTSLASEPDRRRGVEAGASAYIVKSAFEQRILLDTIRRLL